MSLLLVAALLSMSDPAVQTPAPATAPAAQPVKEKKICRVDTNDSSSRLRKRVCLTQSEWDRQEGNGVTANDLKNIGAR